MPALLLYGTDEFAIARRLADIAAQTDKDGMNTSRLEARLTSDEELNNAVNAMPFLSDKRLVILANPSQKYGAGEPRKKFTEFLGRIPPTTQLVMHETVEPKEAEKHWLVKWVSKNKDAKAEAWMAPKARDMTGWIVNEMKRQGGKISSEAAKRLA